MFLYENALRHGGSSELFERTINNCEGGVTRRATPPRWSVLHSQARAITGLLRSTPRAVLWEASCLPTARDLLDHRQTRFASRALNADGDHPTHRLLPANFRFGQLHRHEGATGQPSSIGWTRPEKTHRSFGSRLAQQIARHVSYDTEYGFELPRKTDSPTTNPVIRTQGYSCMPQRMQPENPQQLTLFVSTDKDTNTGVGVVWRERNAWKTKVSSLGKHITTDDAALFAIGMAARDLISTLSRTNHNFAEIVTESRIGLTAVESSKQWVLPVIASIKRQAQSIEAAGGRMVLTWLRNREDVEGYKIANAAAQRAARQQPKEMRSASLSHVKQAVKEKWKPTTKTNKNIADTKKSFAARYLQLKSGHAITGVHLLRIGKVQDATCWWCRADSQTVAHLMLKCRKWRRQRDCMLRELRAKKISISRRDREDLKTLFGNGAIAEVLRFIDNTEVGTRLEKEGTSDDWWDIERLDQSVEEENAAAEDGRD